MNKEDIFLKKVFKLKKFHTHAGTSFRPGEEIVGLNERQAKHLLSKNIIEEVKAVNLPTLKKEDVK